MTCVTVMAAPRQRPCMLCYLITGFLLVLGCRVHGQQCPSGYTQTASGRCLQLFTATLPWQNADDHCVTTGGRLAQVRSSHDPVMTFLSSQSQQSSVQQVWVGLRRSRTEWHWTTVGGSARYFEPQGCYTNINTGTEFRERIGADNTYTPPVCKQLCLSRGHRDAGIMRFRNPDIPLECRCSDTFNPNYNQISPCVWRCPADSTFYCGSIFDDPMQQNSLLVFRLVDVHTQFDGWERGQPNNNYHDGLYPYQACNALDLSVTQPWGWNDENCADTTFSSSSTTVPYSHLCQYAAQTETECINVLGGGRRWAAGRCISQHVNSRVTWFEARQLCSDTGGQLLRVDNQHILNELVNVSGCCWVGDQTRWWIDGVSEIWTWSDGSQLSTYTNWKPNQPLSQTKSCVALSAADGWKWIEMDCGQLIGFVCEAALYTTPATMTTSTTTTPSTTTPTTTTTTTTRPTTTTTTVSRPATPSTTTTAARPPTTQSTVSVSTTSSKSQASVASTRSSTPGPPNVRRSTPGPPSMPGVATDDASFNTTSIPSAGHTDGVIVSVSITTLIVVVTTIRML